MAHGPPRASLHTPLTAEHLEPVRAPGFTDVHAVGATVWHGLARLAAGLTGAAHTVTGHASSISDDNAESYSHCDCVLASSALE
jgi:hypothetical protein